MSDMLLPVLSDFESRLSTLIANSGLSAQEAIVAVGISMARVLYGLEELHGKDAAVQACELLDHTMVKTWVEFSGHPRTVN